MSDIVTVSCYLILEASGPGYNRTQKVRVVAVRQTAAALSHNQRSMRLTLELPRAMFLTPQIEARISVPEDQVAPATVTAETLGAIQEAITQQTGVHVSLQIVEPSHE